MITIKNCKSQKLYSWAAIGKKDIRFLIEDKSYKFKKPLQKYILFSEIENKEEAIFNIPMMLDAIVYHLRKNNQRFLNSYIKTLPLEKQKIIETYKLPEEKISDILNNLRNKRNT